MGPNCRQLRGHHPRVYLDLVRLVSMNGSPLPYDKVWCTAFGPFLASESTGGKLQVPLLPAPPPSPEDCSFTEGERMAPDVQPARDTPRFQEPSPDLRHIPTDVSKNT